MKKQVIIFIVLVLALIVFNSLLNNAFVGKMETVDTQELINNQKVNSEQLFNKSWKTIKNTFYDSSLNQQDWMRWKNHYKGKIKTDEDANIAINTILASLDDPYSRYLTKKDYAEQNESIDSRISGIGVNITSYAGKIYVVSVIEGTPAAEAKLQTKDIIIEVNGKNVNGMAVSDVANLVRGSENTYVNLTILRNKHKILKKIPRKEIKIKTVKSSIDKNIGYIQIKTFIGVTTPKEFLEALDKTEKTEGLILDLRGNTGGLLPNAVFIANMFIDNGNLVSIVGRNGYKRDIYAQETDYEVHKPLLVLVDGGSASASEILSGALKDYHKAKLIGTKTFGKGMVQKIIPMPNGTGLNLTIAKYLTPAGHDINKKGISPDIEAELTQKDISTRNDSQLKKAKVIMTQMIKDEVVNSK